MLAATVALERYRQLEAVQLSRTAGQYPVAQFATHAGHWRAGSTVRKSAGKCDLYALCLLFLLKCIIVKSKTGTGWAVGYNHFVPIK